MIELKWNLNKARVWLDSVPNWNYQVADELQRNFAAPGVHRGGISRAAVELFVPAGGRSHFGGLGAVFTPEQSGRLEVWLCVAKDSGQTLQGSLVDHLDMAYAGIAAEYADGIFTGIVDTRAYELLGSGRLQFCRGVHGALGSSEWLFRVLSRAVVRLLVIGDQPLTNEALIELLRLELATTSH